MDKLIEDLTKRHILIRWFTSRHFKHTRCKAPNVCFESNTTKFTWIPRLRRHVIVCASDVVSASHACSNSLNFFGNAKVSNYEIIVVVDEQICGL